MKKGTTILILVLIVVLFLGSLYYLSTKNKKDPEVFTTELPEKRDVVKSTVATGNIVPKEEILIKPNISGLVEEVFVEAGNFVKAGDMIAKIRVIPNVGNLNAAQNQVQSSKINLENQKKVFERFKNLYDKGIIPANEFDPIEASYLQAQQTYQAALENLEIVKTGSTKGMGQSALTLIKSTITGMILEIPVKEGNQVIETNNFNEGTTIAVLADINNMIFEGKVDESEVGKIKENMDIEITIGALPDLKYNATLDFIAPKGISENGAIQFEIKGTLDAKQDDFIRAGLSANANIILDRADSVLAIKESLLQFDQDTKQAYVEIETSSNVYERKNVELGLTDGIYVEIKEGLNENDKIKVWNKPNISAK